MKTNARRNIKKVTMLLSILRLNLAQSTGDHAGSTRSVRWNPLKCKPCFVLFCCCFICLFLCFAIRYKVFTWQIVWLNIIIITYLFFSSTASLHKILWFISWCENSVKTHKFSQIRWNFGILCSTNLRNQKKKGRHANIY